jgi:hypothetical protein
MEEDPRTLWLALQTRFEQQKAVILPEALNEWNHLRLQDFKSMGEFNHVVHKLNAKLKFCEKEPFDAEKIEKTLSTMLLAQMILQQQYRERGFTVYSELIKTLLQEKSIVRSLCGTPTYVPWELILCQKFMLTLRISSKGMPLTMVILETSKGRTSARDRDSVSLVVLTKERIFLSQTIRSLTSLALVTSVAITATRLRNVALLSTWWNCM